MLLWNVISLYFSNKVPGRLLFGNTVDTLKRLEDTMLPSFEALTFPNTGNLQCWGGPTETYRSIKFFLQECTHRGRTLRFYEPLLT